MKLSRLNCIPDAQWCPNRANPFLMAGGGLGGLVVVRSMRESAEKFLAAQKLKK
jgi:hypothetical protein